MHRLPLLLAVVPLLSTGCSDSGGSVGPGGDVVALRTLSGVVREAGGAPVEGVEVTELGGQGTATDADGNFLLVDLLPGPTTRLLVDGSTATAAGKRFPSLLLEVQLGEREANVLSHPITLPDLLSAAGGSSEVALGGGGALTAALQVDGPTTDLRLTGAPGTIVSVDGQPSEGSVLFALQPASVGEVPVALPDGFVATSAVLVEPVQAQFSPGLSLRMPNTLGLADGTEVTILALDTESGEWEQREGAAGEAATTAAKTVDSEGGTSFVAADGVVTTGGWYAAAVPESADCTTTVVGRVLDADLGTAVPGVAVTLSTGDFATTSLDGRFRIEGVPTYDVATGDALTCQPAGFSFELRTPPTTGSVEESGAVAAGNVQLGGTTDVGTFELVLDPTGSVAGLLVGALTGEPVAVETLSGSPVAQPPPSASGAFSLVGLEPGGYRASYRFADDDEDVSVPFDVGASFVTTLVLNELGPTGPVGPTGPGGGDGVQVLVLRASIPGDTVSFAPAPGAPVTLVGSDGVVRERVTGSDGRASFGSVPGPYSATAQDDFEVGGFVVRQATSVVGIDPPSGTIGILIPIDDDLLSLGGADDATVRGSVSDPDALPGDDVVLSVFAASSFFFLDGISDSFTADVPADLPVYAVFQVRNANQGPFAPIRKVHVVGPLVLAPNEILDVDVNLADADSVLFDRTVDVALENTFAAAPAFYSFNLYDDEGNFVAFLDRDDTGGLQEPQLSLPDPDDPNLAGFVLRNEVQVEGVGGTQSCERLLDDSPTVTFDLPDVPSISNPAGAPLTVAQAESLEIRFSSPAGGAGFDQAFLFGVPGLGLGGGIPAGVDQVGWLLYAPAGSGSISLPPTRDPMFGPGTTYELFVEPIRTDAPLTFDGFFDADVAEELAEVITTTTELCFSLASVSVPVQ